MGVGVGVGGGFGLGLAEVAKEVQSLRDALVVCVKKRYNKETSKGTDLKHVTAPLQAAIELVSIVDRYILFLSSLPPEIQTTSHHLFNRPLPLLLLDRVLPTICPSPLYTSNNAILPEWMDAYRQVLDLLRSSLNREVPHYLLESRVKVRTPLLCYFTLRHVTLSILPYPTLSYSTLSYFTLLPC